MSSEQENMSDIPKEISELFVPYLLARELQHYNSKEDEIKKRVLFEDKCIAFWNDYRELHFNHTYHLSENFLKAPMYQQVINWFKDKHQIFIDLQTDCTSAPKYCYEINIFKGNPKDLTEREWGWTEHKSTNWFLYRKREEAYDKAIKEALQLI